jgi:hypothetical protein
VGHPAPHYEQGTMSTGRTSRTLRARAAARPAQGMCATMTSFAFRPRRRELSEDINVAYANGEHIRIVASAIAMLSQRTGTSEVGLW